MSFFTARHNFFDYAMEPIALYLAFVTVCIPELAGFPSGAAAILFLKLVPVCWNAVLRSNGIDSRVIRMEPTRRDFDWIIIPAATLLVSFLDHALFVMGEDAKAKDELNCSV
ncbi:hypothetical protein B0H17DRAFT_1080433 [Mycena rosella]|uniref:Uncharacterized protein n=1 Tax=Mycena rosella TaxID=1033263 RepID=A0AAD7GAM0_MYCRO|nr:hypothetical protein B0H17DRAFT_1080433 [Mycena rosella]